MDLINGSAPGSDTLEVGLMPLPVPLFRTGEAGGHSVITAIVNIINQILPTFLPPSSPRLRLSGPPSVQGNHSALLSTAERNLSHTEDLPDRAWLVRPALTSSGRAGLVGVAVVIFDWLIVQIAWPGTDRWANQATLSGNNNNNNPYSNTSSAGTIVLHGFDGVPPFPFPPADGNPSPITHHPSPFRVQTHASI
ncbi:hypothetical protein BO94DRAFT_609554 [Aspergillus sclerotioniger CBS 115572]|uniref:Uncharacterized protein n=1 Tax=Aspergillus sclerotioniger CBS 115572 TaxID=1450535 RepID=A0A317X9S3_9EURO|nr:hypothetical protein BO94DRAFT_609554 [Aspergillus sclerotioniger CBS 115572]PWY94377.1 hypothetical protein BO94DRAFT_609554 [Aspergillus sclerotioniger CBS 115572]